MSGSAPSANFGTDPLGVLCFRNPGVLLRLSGHAATAAFFCDCYESPYGTGLLPFMRSTGFGPRRTSGPAQVNRILQGLSRTPYRTGESFPSIFRRTTLIGGIPCFRKLLWNSSIVNAEPRIFR